MSYVFSYKKISDEKHKMRFTKKIKQFSRSAQLFFFRLYGRHERERTARNIEGEELCESILRFSEKKSCFSVFDEFLIIL